MAKKKESIIEEGKEVIAKAAKKVGKIVDEVADDVEEAAKDIMKGVKEVGEGIAEEVEELVDGKNKKTKKDSDSSKKSKLEELKAKAKALEGKVKALDKLDIKEEVVGEKEEKTTLVPIEEYLKSSIHLGTRVITPDMRKYVYKRRADGLAVFNTELLDKMIIEAAEYLSQFKANRMIIVCKREAGWNAVAKMGQVLGIKTFTKKYPAGCLTNSQLENFIEPDLVFIFDPWLDKNALEDANKIRINAMGVCDTNNFTKGLNKIIPGNNKSAKSIGMICYLLTKKYIENNDLDIKVPAIEEFIDGWKDAVIPA